jgi:hypothetical protein
MLRLSRHEGAAGAMCMGSPRTKILAPPFMLDGSLPQALAAPKTSQVQQRLLQSEIHVDRN